MPSNYAHYRFGAQVLPGLPEETRSVIRQNRSAFDVGTHGPDLFFYYSPLGKTPVSELGSKFHRQSGREFFTGACRRLRLEPSKEGTAYLYGVLAHYSLDSMCHPLVCEESEKGIFSHTALESEFDRFLLEKDGKASPHTQDLTRHLRLSREGCAAAAAFYPPVTAEQIRRALREMVYITRLLRVSSPALRQAVRKILRLTGEGNVGLMMPEAPDQRCAHLDEPLLELYEQALERYRTQAEQLRRHLSCGAPLGELFEPSFG